MMSFYFLLYCSEDDSYCLHQQSDVLCDPKVVKVGDNVIFWHGTKKWNGQIVQKSRNEEYLEGELSTLNKERRRGKSAKPVECNSLIESNRISRKPRSYFPSDYSMPKKKKQDEQPKCPVISDTTPETSPEKTNVNLLPGDRDLSKTKKPLGKNTPKEKTSIKSQRSRLSFSTSADEEFDTPNTPKKKNETTYSDDEYISSLSSDELKKIISKMKARNKLRAMKQDKNSKSTKKDGNMRTKEKNPHGIIKDDEKQPKQDSSDDDNGHGSIADKPSSSNQLFGKIFPGAKMLHLEDGIYCKENDYEYATSGGSTKASHVARRLMVGVFKNEAVLRCTLTGAPPKAHGKERQSTIVEALDSSAKNAILQFAMEYAQKKKWTFQPEDKVRAQMSQKLGEIKRDIMKKQK